MMREQSYSSEQADLASPRSAVTENDSGAVPRRRRPPSPAERARRKEWGEKWGKIVSEEAQRLRKGWQ